MKLKSMTKNKLAVSAIIAATLLALVTLATSGAICIFFLNAADGSSTTATPMISIGINAKEGSKSFTIISAPGNPEWENMELTVNGAPYDIGLSGDVTAGDEIEFDCDAETVHLIYTPLNTLVAEHTFPDCPDPTETPPDAPYDPIPIDFASDISRNPQLSVLVTDSDDDNMDVKFYNTAALNSMPIGIVTNVESGTRASFTWSGLEYSTTYSWYAVADDGEYTTQSETWEFQTEDNDEIAGWPMYGHNPAQTGYTTSAAPDTNNLLWEHPLDWWAMKDPVVYNSKVYIGSDKLYCLDAETGGELWNYPTEGGAYSVPAVADGKVYVGSDGGKVYCLNAETGSRIWDRTIGEDMGDSSSPTVVDGKVYIGSNVPDDNVYCLDADDGHEIWTYPINGPVYHSPAIVDGKVYIMKETGEGSFSNEIHCLHASNGAYIWSSLGYSHVIVDGKIYTTTTTGYMPPFTYKIWCRNAATGNEIWSSTLDSSGSSPAVAYGKVYIGLDGTWPENEGSVSCFDAETGDEIWNEPTGSSGSSMLSSLAIADNKIYVGSKDDKVYCFNAATGAKIWDYTTGGDVYSSPAIADGKIYIGSSDGNVYCFGETLSTFNGQATWAAGPTGTGHDRGESVAVDDNGNVYVAGYHASGFDFGNDVTVADEGFTGVFVVKYNSAGIAQWASGPTGPGVDYGWSVAVDVGGNVYVAGNHASGLDFGNDITIPDEGSSGVFVVKYNSAGIAQWASGPTGPGLDEGHSVAVDNSGNVYVAGYHASGLDFGNDITIPDEGSIGVFVVKYNSAGIAQWASGPTGPGYDEGHSVAVDNSGNVYVAGIHSTGLDFGNDITIPDEGSRGVFVVKYNSAGIAQWASGPTGPGYDYGRSIAVDDSGNVYAAGSHASGLDFGNDITIPDEGSSGVFVVKYNSAGIAQWASGPTGPGSDYGRSIAVDDSGNVYAAGSHASGLDFGNDITIPDEGSSGVFVVKYNSAGIAQWASGPTGPGSDWASSAAVDNSGNVYAAGSHYSGLDFGNGVTVANAGPFVVKYS